ncbi:MAG: VacJ family lipoprotein [Gammaproteobacteria bacterium]|nr:VacJ family lipoprotein [Gammaproteobacteria bacterium]
MTNSDRSRLLPLVLLLTALLSGCVTLEGDPWAIYDPLEPANRNLYAAIDTVDSKVITPVARGYRTVMPDWAEKGVSNFFRNVRRIDSVANSLLQGKARNAGEDLAGLLVNSTLGLGGFLDVGSRMGLRHHDEDFGQTLAVWGVTRTRYVYLPSGPSTIRDAPGTAFKSWIPSVVLSGGYTFWVGAIDLLSVRADALPLSDARDQTALDAYVFTRDAWYQRRKFLTFDGDPPVEDLFEEFEEEFQKDFEASVHALGI